MVSKALKLARIEATEALFSDLVKHGFGHVPSHLKSNAATARELFKLGWGTDRIAAYWQISEPEAVRRLDRERSNALGLPLPVYEAAR